MVHFCFHISSRIYTIGFTNLVLHINVHVIFVYSYLSKRPMRSYDFLELFMITGFVACGLKNFKWTL